MRRQPHSVEYAELIVSGSKNTLPRSNCCRLVTLLLNPGLIHWLVHEYSSQTIIPKKGSPHPMTEDTAPVTIGHEISGEVLEIGIKARNPQGLKVGDKVAIFPILSCDDCDECHGGYTNCCPKSGSIGLSGGGGGLSDAVVVDAQSVFKLPDNVPLNIGALVEPLCVAWHGVDKYPITPDVQALVFGAGPIGLGVVLSLRARGVTTIIVVEVAAERKRLAKQFGATHVVDPRTEDVVKRAKEICGGVGPHLALDAAGVPSSIKSAALAVRPRAVVVNLAVWEKEVGLNPRKPDIGRSRERQGANVIFETGSLLP